MPGRFYKILENFLSCAEERGFMGIGVKGFHILFYVILIGLFLKGEVFRVHTKWLSLTFTSVKNLVPLFILWWFALRLKKRPKISLWLLPIIFLGIISVLFSKYSAESLKAGLVLAIYIFWFYGVLDILKGEGFIINTAILMIFFSGLINVADLFFHYSVGLGEIIEKYPFWQGKNALGLFLVMALCVSGSFAYRTRWKLLGLINSILLIIGIVFSYSRSAWISLLSGIAGLVLYRFKRALWIIIICAIIFLLVSPSFVSERFNSIFKKDDLNIKQRLELWNHCIEMVKQRPVIGTGLGTFAEAYKAQYPDSVPVSGEGSRIIRHAHNLYLQILVETGILGLVLFIILIVMGFMYGIKNFIKEQNQILKSIRYGSLLGIFAFLIYSITDCTISWQFMGDSFSHINLIWILLWAVSLKPRINTNRC